jgi:hypothetical protein
VSIQVLVLYAHLYTLLHTHIHIYVHIPAHIHIYDDIQIHVPAHVHIRIHLYIHGHVHIPIHIDGHCPIRLIMRHKRLLFHKGLFHFLCVRYGTLRAHFVLERFSLLPPKMAAIPREELEPHLHATPL